MRCHHASLFIDYQWRLSGNFARGTFDDLELHQAWVSEHWRSHDVCWGWTAWDFPRNSYVTNSVRSFVGSLHLKNHSKNHVIYQTIRKTGGSHYHIKLVKDDITSFCKVQRYAGCCWVGLNYTVSYDVILYDITVYCIAVCSIVLSHMVFPYRIGHTIIWICSLLW